MKEKNWPTKQLEFYLLNVSKYIFFIYIRKGKKGKRKGSPYSITECRVPELIPVLGSQPAGDLSHLARSYPRNP